MFDSITLSGVLVGVGVVGGLYFASLVATKGFSAAVAFVKARVSSIEGDLVAGVQKDLATAKADIALIKTKIGL